MRLKMSEEAGQKGLVVLRAHAECFEIGEEKAVHGD
jgi:hypothetical protein